MKSSVAILLVLCGALSGQGDAAALDVIVKEFRNWKSHRDVVGVAEAERVLRRLATLRHAAPEVRERACEFLKGIIVSPAPQAEVYRWRVVAVGLLGLLADEEKWAPWLMGVAKQKREALRGLEFWVERALGELRTVAHTEYLLSQLDGEDTDRARLALGGLSSMHGRDQVRRLAEVRGVLQTKARDPDPEIRMRAVLALGGVAGTGEAVPSLFGAARDRSPIVRLAAARACARLGRRPGVEPVLGHLLRDDVALVREEAAVAAKTCGNRELAPALIRRLDKEPMRVRVALAGTLNRLTGRDFPPEYAPWKDWWDAQEEPGGALRPTYARPTYYDVPVESDRLLFILDTSMSMGYALHENTRSVSRLTGAKKELTRVIQSLDERSRFNVMTFSTGIGSWAKQLVKADAAGKRAAVRFVSELGHAGKTNSYGVLEAAFARFPEVDTIYFVTDGIPTVGKTTVQEHIVERVARWNRLRGVRIHTIAAMPGEPDPPVGQYTPNTDAIRFMRFLAAETGGTFTRVR